MRIDEEKKINYVTKCLSNIDTANQKLAATSKHVTYIKSY